MKEEKTRKKSFSPISLIIAGIIVLFSAESVVSDEVVGFLAIALFLLVPAIAIGTILMAAKKKQAPQTHSHDRIDHRSDLKINPQTGKVSSTPRRMAVQHSPQEHWKQQLDGLLANGTIDRAEYRALMNRRF